MPNALKKTRKQLEAEVEELRKALEGHAAIQNAAPTLVESNVMVPVKNFSTNYMVFPYEFRGNQRRLELDISGRKMTGALPLEIWNEMERSTPFVKEGYIARTDQPLTNPNIIEDAEALVNNLAESDFANRIKEITNVSSLYKLVAYLEPLKDKDGKRLAAQRSVRNRVMELTGVQFVDNEE